MLQHAVQAFLIAAVLSPFSYYAGKAANLLRLPQITGYLVSGIICGPYVLGILNQESVTDLNIIEGACLGIIGLAAGAELLLSELNRSKRQVVSLTAGICVMTWFFCYFAIKWSASLTPVLPSVSSSQLTAIASLGGTLMMARSPASAIAVLKEMDAKGPFVSLVMGVVVLKDVVVIVLFALNMELVPMMVSQDSAAFGLIHMLLPLLSVGVSITAGLLGGYLMSLALQFQLHSMIVAAVMAAGLNGGVPPAVLLARCKQLVVLLLSTAVFSITRSLEAEPLLACVTAGMVLANRRPSGAGTDLTHEELTALINSIMRFTNVAFFGLAGASLKLAAIADSVWVALVVVLARLAAIVSGSWLGCRFGGVKQELHSQCFWMSMITQAGVAMGLARIAGTAFSGWGPAFQTVMMAIIMVNMLTGPPFFRAALIKVGEARAHFLPSHGVHQSLHRDNSEMPPLAADSSDGVVTRHTSSKTVGVAAAKSSWVHPLGSSNSSVAPRSGSGQLLQLANVGPAGKVASKADAAAADPGGDEYSHHVVVSSGTLLGDMHAAGDDDSRRVKDSTD
ncbi:hypothetical protein OEZ85_007974 [Tetradesmus obliquus]|uniref:Cation/H+ exchanger transmembrane domain-containing protein n=1 Tax=Tetradesmus obliquus TaxID=3088 RepID=A0ABY8THJ1_TETOB|nr:hypothetical protein OEZ85_007974 [Tetradesmus obliquus]